MQVGMKGVKSSPKIVQIAEAERADQYYSGILVINFNDLLSL